MIETLLLLLPLLMRPLLCPVVCGPRCVVAVAEVVVVRRAAMYRVFAAVADVAGVDAIGAG